MIASYLPADAKTNTNIHTQDIIESPRSRQVAKDACRAPGHSAASNIGVQPGLLDFSLAMSNCEYKYSHTLTTTVRREGGRKGGRGTNSAARLKYGRLLSSDLVGV